ncbi:hypothetical protein Hanom_Chr02g00123811 [Helianthus anomalus]
MVKGCMLRMGYSGPLNNVNYLKANFSKPYKFFIHSIVHALSHRKGGYDVMRDYQMNMVTTLVLNKKYNFSRIIFHYMKENITSKSKTWIYPRFVQMILDHAYPDLEKDENNDLLALYHMDNETWKVLARYHKNHPESSTKEEFFGFIKDKRTPKDQVEEAGENEGDNEEKSSSSSSESEIDETERLKRIKAEIEKEKQLKRKRIEEKDDDLYIPSSDHVQDYQTPPPSG